MVGELVLFAGPDAEAKADEWIRSAAARPYSSSTPQLYRFRAALEDGRQWHGFFDLGMRETVAPLRVMLRQSCSRDMGHGDDPNEAAEFLASLG